MIVIIVPKITSHGWRITRPLIANKKPMKVISFKVLIAALWWLGRSFWVCLSKTRSPSTAFEAQLFVDFGLLKTLGFIHIQRQTKKIGITHIQPIQTLDQAAKHKSGRHEYRVKTLHGLACFCQTSSDIWKSFSVVLSMLMCPYSTPSPNRSDLSDGVFSYDPVRSTSPT